MSIVLHPQDLTRQDVSITAIGAVNPSNHNYVLGWFHRVTIEGGGVRHRRSDTPGGVFVVNTQVTTDATDADPHTVTDWRGTLRTLFCRPASGILEVESNDDGLTFSEPVVAISGGKHPVCPVGHAGEIFRAAYVSGNLKGMIQYPGDTTLGTLTTFKDSTGTALTVEDDTFGLSAAHEGAGRWFLSVRISGEGTVSDWYSSDDGSTFTRVT